MPAVYTIDTFGRRNLLLTTFPLMALFLFFTAFSFLIPNQTASVGCIALGIYLFTIVYSPGEGPVPFTYSAEAYPLYVRGLGMSCATATTWCVGFSNMRDITNKLQAVQWCLVHHVPSIKASLYTDGSFLLVCGMEPGWVFPRAVFRARDQTKDAGGARSSVWRPNARTRSMGFPAADLLLPKVSAPPARRARGAVPSRGDAGRNEL